MTAVSPLQEVVDIINEEGGEILKLCYQCGTYTAVCPWNKVRDFIVRRIMHQGQLGLIDFEDEDVWLCATCNNCVKRCPRGVEIIDVMRALDFTVPGILAHEAAMGRGEWMDVPKYEW